MHSRMRLSNHRHDVVPGAFDRCPGRVHSVLEAAGFEDSLHGGNLFRYGGCAGTNLITDLAERLYYEGETGTYWNQAEVCVAGGRGLDGGVVHCFVGGVDEATEH